MKIHATQSGRLKNVRRKNLAVRSDDRQVSVQRFELFDLISVVDAIRLEYGDVPFKRGFLHHVDVTVVPFARSIRLSKQADDLMMRFAQTNKRWQCKPSSAHENKFETGDGSASF